jgi:hypothetical protein
MVKRTGSITATYISWVLVTVSLCGTASVWAQTEQVLEEAKQGKTPGLSVEEILQRDPERSDYGEAPRCLSTSKIRSVDVIDGKHISFRMSRSEYYLVQFEHACPGLRRGRPIIYEPGSNSRLCVLDGIRGTYDFGGGGLRPGMRCSINGFESVTKEQLVLLKDALKVQKRKKKRDA